MLLPQVPTNEKQRLRSLRSLDILDSLPEEEFDNITKLACQITGMPISLISLVDQKRQWFKSKQGLEANETDRDWSFCAHAINDPDQMFIVQDTHDDERFSDNPLTLNDPFIRFYAGMPFKDDSGYPLGTLCVIDKKPNHLSQEKIETLKILANHVSSLIQVKAANLGLVRSQKEYQTSRENIAGIIENTDDAIWSVDRNIRFKIINGVYAALIKQLTGHLPEVGENALDRENIKFENLKPYYERALAGEKFDIEYDMKSHGMNAIFRKYFNPIIDASGKVTGVSVFAREITEEKRVSDQASRYREGLQLLNKISSNSSLSVNSKIKEALELTCDYLKMPIGFLSKVEGEEVIMEALHDHYGDTFEQGMVFPFEKSFASFIYEKGETLGLSNLDEWDFRGFPTLMNAGIKSCVGAIVPMEDGQYGTISFASKKEKPFDTDETDFVNLLSGWISSMLERQHYEKRLIAEKDTLKAFVNSAPAAIAMFNKNVEYIAASAQWNEEYFLGDRDLVGVSHYEVFPETTDDWRLVHQRALYGEVVRRERDLFRRANDEKQWIQWEVRPWYSGDSTIGGIIMFTEDVTLQVLQEEELKIARDEAERASKAKDLFLSTMSHEIRTPMNAIIGLSNILIADDPKPEQLENLKLLKFSSSSLLTLINDILDFNKIEAGKMDLETIDFNLKEVASSVYQTLQLRANEKDLVVFFEYERGLPEYFKGDPVRLAQILTNLLNNAIKFTETGLVRLNINLKERKGSDITLSFKVIDTGVGIPADKLDAIFENFTQASSSVTRNFGGTGLGLSICKKLLNLMESDIHVESEEGVGSTFYFDLTLPIGEVKSLDATREEIININNNLGTDRIRLLIAEDHPANQKVLSKFLDRWEMRYEFANNGEEALKLMQQKAFSMILMDIQMPVMDGYEASKRIRALGDHYYKSIPIFALTASVLLGVQELVASSGMNGYIGKPFDPDDLYEKIVSNAIRLGGENQLDNLIDDQVIDQLSLGDQVFADQLKTYLVEQVKEVLADLEQAPDAKDQKKIAEISRRIEEFNKDGAVRMLDQLINDHHVDEEVLERITAMINEI